MARLGEAAAEKSAAGIVKASENTADAIVKVSENLVRFGETAAEKYAAGIVKASENTADAIVKASDNFVEAAKIMFTPSTTAKVFVAVVAFAVLSVAVAYVRSGEFGHRSRLCRSRYPLA
jgi:hypothetical protein